MTSALYTAFSAKATVWLAPAAAMSPNRVAFFAPVRVTPVTVKPVAAGLLMSIRATRRVSSTLMPSASLAASYSLLVLSVPSVLYVDHGAVDCITSGVARFAADAARSASRTFHAFTALNAVAPPLVLRSLPTVMSVFATTVRVSPSFATRIKARLRSAFFTTPNDAL
ncbi:hypothetical protein AALK14_14785 [Butyricimonas hominis]|uniref:hypothetical protein n=1 Tax=Butyricimonas TaxID=574697 RepID=UPI0035132600